LSAGEGENVWAFSFFLNIKATRVVTKGVDIIITSARVLWILFTARLLFLNTVHPQVVIICLFIRLATIPVNCQLVE
jgi:hypothetical protein